MKKFAKILGFLGFFVTLATAQIGTAWADGAYCSVDGYYGLGRDESDCHPCREYNEDYPNSRGGYNFSEDLCYQNCSGSCADANSSFQAGGTYGIPATSTFFVYKLNNGTQNSLLNINGLTCGNIGNYCAEVFDCGKNACSANWKTINFVDHNNNPLGTLYIVYGMIWSTQQTTECDNCAQNTRNYAVFYPVFQTPTAPTREGYTFRGYSDSQTGGIIRIGPDHSNMYGKLNYNNATSISGISGNTITLYARYENAGCAQNYWYNSQTDECIPCAEGFTSPGGYGDQHTCTKSCHRNCAQQHSTEQNCAEGVEGFYTTTDLIYGTEYQDQPERCFDDNNTEIFAPNTDPVPAHWCTWNCEGCSNPQCYDYVDGACVPKKFKATYECNGTSVHTDSSIEYLSTYPIANVSCAPQTGQEFEGWLLNLDTNQTPYNNPEELIWKWCSDGIFTPSWTDTCYEVSFDDDTNGGHPSGYPASTPGTHGPFYKKYNDTQYNWYTNSECTEKVNGGNPSVANNLPWKEHAQFTGYKDEDGTNWTIFNANGNLTTGNNSGSDWTITDTTVLYAQYTCDKNYELDANGNCVGDKIDVKYTCVSPVDGGEPEQRTFNDDATYGTAYPVKSVGTGNHNVQCAFTGYELNNNYVWNLQDYSGNSNNPNGEYGPGADAGNTLLSTDWQYITTTPLAEIEFVLDKSMCHLKTYNVEYRCGNIKPGADVYTDSSATYGQTYSVAGQFDPIDGSAVTVQDFLDNNCKPNGGFGAWTFQNWTFTCDGANSGPYNTNDPTFGPWTYDSNNCYFTANWAQTDFVITLDSNIDQDPMNNGSNVGVPEELYTRLNDKVYSCPERTNSCEMGSLTAIPTKVVTVTLNGNGGQFTWNNETVSEATDDSKFTFLGFYESEESNSEQYIYGEDDANSGLITNRGKEVGIGYDGTNAPYTWYAHWENRDAVILPEPIERPGFTFNGWLCVHEEVVPGVDPTQYNGGDPILNGSFVPEDNATCTALWTEACYEIEFNDNGGTPSSNGTHPSYYKKHNNNEWYTNATCASVDDDPTVANNMPSKEHATFTGYYDETQNPDLKIFAGTNDTPQGGLTSDGASWTVTDNATLYAQYECVAPYHLMDDGSCGSCPGGSFYNPSSTNPNHCDNCDQYLHAPDGTWHTRSPYNWSVKQCYRVCDGAGDTQQTCDVVNTVSDHSEMEQFLTENLINGNTGKQISFYGNEFATSGAFNTCNSETGVTNCPQGFLASGASGANKLMAAAVDFYEDRDLNGTYEPNGKRYIVGGRIVTDDGYKLNDGFVWSQVVGDAQLEGNTDGNPGIISIIYPATLAPTVADPEHHTFTGYGYPESNPSQNLFVDSNYSLTSGSDGNAEEIIDFANDNNYSNMSPIIADGYTRNLYAQYTAADSYTLTYSCGEGGGTPPAPRSGIYAGNTVSISVPSDCSHYSTHSLTEWVVTATDGEQNLGRVSADTTSFVWAYTQDVTFTAVWGNANTHSIIYNKIPVSDVNASGITGNGNTYVPGTNGGTPTTFTCGDGTTNITGQPQLKNSDGDVIGEVKQWCDNNDLSSECSLPKTISHTTCTDKNVYAKWECTDSRYHLNETEDDCVACRAGEYWDENEGCKSCSLIGAGWTSKPGYNQSINQCYRICNGSNGTADVSCESPDVLLYPGFNMTPIVDDENHQIEFYGNWRYRGTNPELDVCGTNSADVTYCARIIRPLFTTYDADRLMSSKVTFKNNNNEDAGTRHLVGYTPAFVEDISNISFVNRNKIWSHIMGPGQYATGYDNRDYVYTIYPTNIAPNPGDTGAQFMGYYDGTGSNATQRVAAALGLDSNNAIAFAQTPLSENQIGDRILYPQYCANGETWNGQSCTGNAYTVKYVCGEHGTVVNGMSMQNTATYGQLYKVAYNGEQLIAQCQANANEGYVLKTNTDGKPYWKLNNTGENAGIESYTEENITWNYTTFDPTNTPTFTAQYDCDDGYTLNGTTCVLDSSNFHTITLDENAGEFYGVASDPNVLYTIEGTAQAYTDEEHNDPFDRLNENGFPRKYAKVTFHFCDGDDNSCDRPSTQNVIKNAYFTFGGFYVQHPDESDRYISADGFITTLGGNVAAGLASDTTWYAVWNDYGTVSQSDWQSNPTPPSGYAFVGWYTAANCGDTPVTSSYQFIIPDTDLYACWSQNTFTVTYNCGEGTGGSQPDNIHPTTGSTYFVLPNGIANGGVVTCNLDGQGFAGWKFSRNTGVNPYNAGDTIPWQAGYGNETLTAQYRTCNSNEVLVNGVCYPTCSVSCVIPSGLQSNGCPVHDPVYPNPNNPNDPDGVRCEYVSQTIGGYDNGDGNCRYISSEDDHEQGEIIPQLGDCRYNVTCNNTSLEWNSDPNVWACVWPSGTVWTVTFKCDVNDSVTTYNVTVPGTIPSVPAASTCAQTGSSFTNWKDADHGGDLLEAGATNVSWTHEYNATYTPDRTQNIYHVNLHAYSCDDSTQTGTFGNSGVQELWEKYGVNWYRTNVGGTLSNPITELTTQQLPTRSGWTFGGYNTLGGDQRVRYANGAWNVSPTTLITEDEEWCAIWSQCNPNEYWNNGVCVTCNTATNGDFPLGDANATSIYQCYRQCSICTPVCPQTEGVDYCEFGNNSNMNGNLYYPGTGTCQPNYEQNCPITVLHCLPGYTNNNNTACLPNSYMITLNSHIDGFNGHASSPEVLYTKYGPNGGAYLDSAYAYLMNDERSLYAVPVKSADVILNGNGGNVIWNGYSSSTATLTATFDFQGFYPSVYGGNQYISDTGYISPNGNSAAQQNQSNSTVWHAQWTNGSITLPNATRDGYTFNGWWTLPGGGTFAGNAGSTYTPVTANPTLYAQWVNGVYYINYHDDEGPLFFNASTSHCTPTTYTYGTQLTISCQLTPTANSHAVFKGWCKTPGADCAATQTITSTDYGNKDYYAWWGCESGYNANNGICEPDTSALCPARTLPNNAHATFVSGALNSNGTECIYTLKCEACTGCNNNNYTCYTHDNSATNGGVFTVNGSIGDASVLNNVSCNATEYDVYYRCDSSTTPGTLSGTQATYGEPYYVESNGTTITCQSNDQLFNGWTFNGNNQIYYPGTSNYMITSWNYCNITPIFTASYGQCPAGQIYVPSLGKCRPSCPVPCTWAGYPANPAQCPTPQYPAGATCWYLEGNPAAQTGYVPEYDPNACLNPMTDATITPQTCKVDPTQDPTCPAHYHWNSGTFSCDPDVYTVTLDPNRESYQNNTIVPGSNNVNELKEKWEYGWSKDGGYQFATDSLILNTNTEVPYWTDGTKVFDGYWTTPSGIGYRMVQANGSVSQNGYQLLPATTITSDTTWYARYVDNPGPFTVTFRCDQDGAILNTQNPSFGDYIDVLAAPQSACTNHPGETFNQWRIVANGMLIPAWYNGTSGMYPWQLHEGSQIVPDWRPVYKVTLDKGATDAVNGNVTSLWDAVGIGWYTNSGLTDGVDSLSDSDLPTRISYTFAGYVDSVSGNPRGLFGSNNTWTLPETTALTSNETWKAEWSRCPDYHYYDNNQCKECDSNYHQNPHPVTHEDCYTNCQGYCQQFGCTTGQNHVIGCDYISESYTGFIHWPNSINGQCPNSNGVVPSCDYCVRCEDGWVRDPNNCKQCIEDAHFIVTLNPHLVNNTQGSYSSPRVLYTWHGKGVYLYDDYSQYLMNGNQNPLVSNPQTFATVTFNLNGDGAWLDWENQRRTDPVDIDVPLTYLGFYKSETDSDMVINTNRYIEPAGTQAGKTATANLEWHAHWQPRQIGTVTGSQLPQPSRPGFNFVGWFNTSASNGGTQIYATTTAAQNMTVYARWSDEIYTVKLVSDKNNCQPSNNTPTELFEKYNVGWNRYTNGTFDPNLILTDDELPTPNTGYVFDGYYDAQSGVQRVIRSDGRVSQEPNYTDNTHTWYARCVRPNGPFTVTFKCDTDGHNVQSGSVNYGANVTAPTVADANCTKPGHTFSKWKAVVNNENIVFSAGQTYSWGYYSGADFVPQWVLDAPYHVTLDQNGATQQGVTDLYEKYGLWWSLYQNGNSTITQLSGNALPRKTGFNFGGYENANGVTMGTYSSTTGVWTLPLNTTVTGDETWTAIWSECGIGEYWDGYKCYPCPDEFTDNPHAIGIEQCYGNCQYDCQESGCPSLLPDGMQSCTPDHSEYPQWGIKYNRPGATCLPQGQQVLPICRNDIICKNGYDLFGTECRDGRYTITLNSNLYNDNGTAVMPSTLYTWRNHGVYSTSLRRPQDEMTSEGNPVNIPSTYAMVTLNGNGVEFNWHNQYGPQLQDNVDFVFDGFYDITNATTNPVIGIDGYITADGQSIGMDTQSNLTWRAWWRDGSVDLPSISRDGYTFDGWWTECNGGTRVSMGDQTIAISGNRTLCAHWSGKSYTVTYNCDSEGGQGGAATDSQLAYQNTTYTVRENFIPCHKDANVSNGTRYYEFENWKFNLNSNSYWPGDPIMWIFNADNPTFNAHYKECPNGWYFDGSCKQCPNGYTSSDIDADSATKCYKTCDVSCTQPTSQCPMNEEGVLTCTYPNNTYPLGKQYSGSENCIYDGTAPACEPFTIMCRSGYTPDYYLSTDTGTHCTKLADHEITLDANCGQGTVIPGNQEKLYTTENTGVYLNPARTNTYQMGLNRNPLVSGDWARCTVTATFNHCDNNEPDCNGANTEQKTVDLGFNGYYKAETNGTRYTDTRQEDGQLKSYITQNGIDAGKGYTANATWFAQWLDGQVGSQKWPNVPTHTGTCGVTYEFVDWYTAANGGNVVSPYTPISENVTWYAHWCESCPTGTIDHGSCSANNCVATFTCDNGYAWNEAQCQCVAATGLTLTYDLAGGTLNPDYYLDGGMVSLDGQQITYNMMYDQLVRTLDGTVATKNKSVLCSWRGLFPELAYQYTYNINENTTLRANWVQCQCEPWGDGVASCDTHVENNLCRPDFTCNPGYVPVQLGACSDDCNATCHVSCTKCPAGTYQNGGQCSPCDGNTVSAAGATQCEPCDPGYTANAEHTQCVGNQITIDWDENGGNAISNGSCVYGETFTLANAPSHSNSAMQFLGWKLANGDIRLAGASVMCNFTNVGVYSGTSTAIQAQWNECQCSDQLNPPVVCQPVIVDDVCRHVYWCDSVGYNLVGDDYSNTSPYCDPKTFDVTYNCGVGATGTPLISADTATYDDTYIVKNAGGVNCQKVGFNFVGWLFDGDNYLHQADDRITWTYTSNKTFTAQYSQCGLGEIWNNGVCICDEDNGYYLINGTCQQCQGYTVWNGTECAPCNAGEIWENGVCKQCTCNEGTGVVAGSCDTQSTSTNTCAGTAECKDGYINPTVVCDGTVCNATCSACELGMIEVDGVCLPCECTNGEGVNSCNATSNNNQCVASGGCKTGYSDFDWTCNGTHCSSQCTPDIYRFVLNQNGGLTGSNFVGQIWEQYGHGWSKNMEGPFTLEGLKADELPSPVDQSTVFGGYYYGTDLMITETGILLPSPNIAEDQTWTAKWNNNNGPFTVRFKCTTNADPFVTYNNVNFDGYINVPNTSECEANGIACMQWKIERNGETIPTEYNGGLYQWNRRYDADIVAICSANTYEITLDDMIGNNATGTNGQGMLYTIFGAGVYRDAARTKQMTETQYPLTVIPTKSADVTLKYCDGDNSSCTNPTINDVVTSLVLSFTGYYESPFSGKKYIEQNTDNGYWYISAYGNTAGTNTADDQTWYAHWNAATMNTLPTPTRDGYEFGGWWNAATSGVQVSAPFAVEENMTLYAHWTPCADGYISTAATGYVCTPCTCNEGAGVVSGSCSTQSTDANTCAGTAECQNGYISPNVTCNGPTCTATCTLGGSNAIYKCGTGIGAGYSTYVSYGATHTILTNAFVGCYRDNSTFAGWAFNGDNTIYFDNVGATVTWNYTAPKEFEAKWCDNCSVVEHGTNQLTIPEPGLCSCVLTCDTGYHVNSSTHTCEPNVYPNENGITYKPNGGTPNQNYTQSVTYDAPFTTLGVVYSKARHILNSWDVESGGAGTFNGTAALNTTYTYHTDGATSLLAEWIECGINEISLDNLCQQCRCTDNNAGVTSCETSATNNDTCSCSGECAAGYINAGCNCNGTNCTQSCTKCADNQVSVNNVCENCKCEKNIDGIEGIISGCGFVSNNGNTCNWNPTTCKLGYGNPNLTCDDSGYNNNCTASCTICPAGTYGDNGVECKQCPEGYTSLPGATSIRECFVDPNSCAPDEHIEHGECVNNTRACSIPNATSAARIWNPAIGTYGPCTVVECDTANGYHESGNACVRDTCVVAHGSAESEYSGGQWECFVTKCDPGYEPSSDYKSCVECANRYVDGDPNKDVAVSSYVSECEIAACMYQGQKYALQNGECVPICENASDETGTKVWDERTKKCIRTCKPGYKMW